MPQEGVSSASAICRKVSRTNLQHKGSSSESIGSVSNRNSPLYSVGVIEQLREQIKCIEGRSPVLVADHGPYPGSSPESSHHNAANGTVSDTPSLEQDALGTTFHLDGVTRVPTQTAFPAGRFVSKDDGAALCPRLPAPSSSLTKDHPTPVWALGEPTAMKGEIKDITSLPLDPAGVHEIKPAFDREPGAASALDWEACWSAARRFQIALVVRRLQSVSSRPVLWCLPRACQSEHGQPYLHGLTRFGIKPSNILFAETGNPQETLWVLEEGLKSGRLALVVGMIDDVELTPARRLALAAQKAQTPCLLLTHPRMPPMGATATRWCVGPAPSAPHALQLNAPPGGPNNKRIENASGAHRFTLALERYRAEPWRETIQKVLVELCDETLCLRLAAKLSDRSHPPRQARFPAAG